jgi:hypothetical protein
MISWFQDRPAFQPQPRLSILRRIFPRTDGWPHVTGVKTLPARPFYWMALAGQLALAVAGLHASPLRASIAAVAVTFFTVGLLSALLWPDKPRSWVLWAVLAPGCTLLLPYVAAFAWVGSIWQAIVADVLGDTARMLVAVTGLFFGSLAGRRTSASNARVTTRPNLKTQVEAAQQLKLTKVRELLTNEDVSDRLLAMINYAVGRVDYYENLRHRHMTIGLAFFTGGTALAGFVLRGATDIPPFTALFFGIAAIVLLTGGAVLTHAYNKTSSPNYVYRGMADIRSWYYRYNMPPGSADELEASVLSDDQDTAVKQAEGVRTDFERFLTRWIALANEKKGLIAEDLEQVFILQFIQSYKQRAVAHMQRIVLRTLFVFSLAAALALAIWMANAAWPA